MKTMLIPIAAMPIILAGCLLPGELFYTGNLSGPDQLLFAEAASLEEAETVGWPAPGAWIVVYGETDDAGSVVPPFVFIAKDHDVSCKSETRSGRDQYFMVVARHEIGHTMLRDHSPNPLSVMHSPPPCWPTD